MRCLIECTRCSYSLFFIPFLVLAAVVRRYCSDSFRNRWSVELVVRIGDSMVSRCGARCSDNNWIFACNEKGRNRKPKETLYYYFGYFYFGIGKV